MRILHLLASPVYSGPAEAIALLASSQRGLGHEVAVAIDSKRSRLGSEEPAAPRLRALALLDDGGLELSVKSTPLAMLRDLRTLRRRQVDVVHAHFSHDHLLARLARPNATLIRSIHAPRSLRWSLPAADGYTVYAEAARQTLAPRRVMRLPALVDGSFAPPADRLSLRRSLGWGGEPLIGMASTFQASRRHSLAIQAFARLRRLKARAHLVLLGDGNLEPELLAQVQANGLDEAVTFAGYQQGAEFSRRLQALDELWVLGLGNDFAGRVAAQARACGVRVVGIESGGLLQLVDAPVHLLTDEGIVAASLGANRAVPPHPDNEDIARQVLEFYGTCRRATP